MLYSLTQPFAAHANWANLFHYITFRAGAACMTSLIVSFIIGPWVIGRLRVMQKQGQPIRSDGPARHVVEKAGTPTMGGVLILAATLGSTLLWVDLAKSLHLGRAGRDAGLWLSGLCR